MQNQKMLKSNYPFGSTITKEFYKGDLVYWVEWKVLDKKLTRFKKLGVFLGQMSKFVGNREVMYGIVLCSETACSLNILGMRLKKEETN
tara:strand:+ start:175 stop:441 length:267 start_codon:yes stop_codon:yes gene_type:complete